MMKIILVQITIICVALIFGLNYEQPKCKEYKEYYYYVQRIPSFGGLGNTWQTTYINPEDAHAVPFSVKKKKKCINYVKKNERRP